MTETTRNPWAILLVLSLGFFMILLDMTIVYVATPSILTSLHTSLDQVLWVFNGYLLAFAVLLITAGRVGDIFGPRQLFAAGLVLFTAASALCGLSQTDTQLIAARVLQGVGGAMLAPQTLTIITSIFPAERRGAAFGIWGAVAGISTILGPTLGGLIVTNWEWRWIFYMNVPLGVIALIGTFVLIPDLRPGRRHRLDLVGVALSSLALFAIVYGLIEGQRYDWGTITGWLTIPMVIGFGIVLLAVFLVFEQFQAEPLLPLRLFTIRNFSIMNWVAAAMAFGMQGIMLPLIIYTQSVLGMSPLLSGLTFAPMSVASMFVAPFAGRLTDRFGGKYFLMGGLTLFGTGMAIVAALATVYSIRAAAGRVRSRDGDDLRPHDHDGHARHPAAASRGRLGRLQHHPAAGGGLRRRRRRGRAPEPAGDLPARPGGDRLGATAPGISIAVRERLQQRRQDWLSGGAWADRRHPPAGERAGAGRHPAPAPGARGVQSGVHPGHAANHWGGRRSPGARRIELCARLEQEGGDRGACGSRGCRRLSRIPLPLG